MNFGNCFEKYAIRTGFTRNRFVLFPVTTILQNKKWYAPRKSFGDGENGKSGDEKQKQVRFALEYAQSLENKDLIKPTGSLQ